MGWQGAILEAGIRSLELGQTHYTSNSGTLELRQAVSAYLERLYGIEYDPVREILITVGVSEALYLVITGIIDPGDEVIIPEPSFVSFGPEVVFAGGVTVSIPTYIENEFQVTAAEVEAAITPRTKALLISYPNNPTGAVMTRERLAELAAVAEKHDLIVISDEIYDRLVYGDFHHTHFATLPHMRPRTVVLGGFSKSHAMTGWRIGYAAFPKGLAARATDIQLHSTSAPCAVSQRAALAALTGDSSHIAMMLAAYVQRRALVLERIGRLPGLSMNPPLGTFYAFVNIRGLIGGDIRGRRLDNADAFTALLQKEARVRVLSGTPFGADSHVRLSFAVSYADLEEGLRRTASLLEEGV